jgi:hypothetical protein
MGELLHCDNLLGVQIADVHVALSKERLLGTGSSGRARWEPPSGVIIVTARRRA